MASKTMKIDIKALLQGIGQGAANTVNAYQGRPLQQFAPIEETDNKWRVNDKPKNDMFLRHESPINAHGGSEDTYGGLRVIVKPGLGTSMGTPLIDNTDPQTMFRRRGNLVNGNPLGFIGQALSNLGNARRMGGDVNANEPYVVGEEGAEIVVPKKKGTVIPNPIVKAILAAAGDGQTPSVPMPPQSDPRSTLQPVNSGYVDELSRQYGRNGFTEQETEVAAAPGEGMTPGINGHPSVQGQYPAYRSPLDVNLASAQKEYESRLAEDPKSLNTGKHKWLKDALIKSAQIFSNIVNPNNQVPIQGWGAQRKQLHVGKAAGNLAPLQKLKDVQQERDYKEARTRTIYEDDRRQRERDEVNRINQDETRKDRRRAAFTKANPFFDAAKATPAQIRALAEFDETPESVGTYDFSKKDYKKVGGVTFVLDKNTNKFVDAGLPQEPGEAQAEIEFIDPGTNQKITLITTSAKKAQMLNSRVVAKLVADAQAARQEDQQGFTAGENEKSRQFTASQNAIKMQFERDTQTMGADKARTKLIQGERSEFAKSYYKINGRQPSEQEIQKYIDAVIMPLTGLGGGVGGGGFTPQP